MGANESRQEIRGDHNDVEDYYALLEVDEEATADEIKVCTTHICMYIVLSRSLTQYTAVFQEVGIEAPP